MKYIKLTQGNETIVDDEDYEFLSQFKWYYNDLEKAITAHKKINQWFHGEFSFDKTNGELS